MFLPHFAQYTSLFNLSIYIFCIRYIEITLIISIKTCKEVTQLVSTSNKRSSSGEMKIDLKRVGICVAYGLHFHIFCLDTSNDVLHLGLV